ncbi:MAG: ISNCY family transposase [Chloroflexota bacterium]|nr:ISNCY family transposase [Chloroflexota bacterium]
MSQKEQARLQALNRVLEGKVKVREVAFTMGVSERHGWRLLASYRAEGAAGLAHGNRGRAPARKTPLEVENEVVELAEGRYRGFNHCHLTDMLAEQEDLPMSRSTVRRILKRHGLASPRRRRAPRHRSRRERYPQEGMLLQIDGSHHDWLEGRGPRLVLISAVDDATGAVPFALFREQEDAPGYFLLLKEIIKRKGIPWSLYSDNHAVFRTNPKAPLSIEEQLAREEDLTQFGRALRELGIEAIFAMSPQAKGRIERLFGTFQDRLVSELRLAGAKTREEANQVLWRFLPRFNQRFGVPPLQPESAYRARPVGLDLDHILCSRYPRTVASDNTVRFNGRAFQLLPGPSRISYARAKVEVCEQSDQTILICYQGRGLPATEAPPLAAALRSFREPPVETRPLDPSLVVGASPDHDGTRGMGVAGPGPDHEGARPQAGNNGKAHKPAPDHPWRRWVLTESLNS